MLPSELFNLILEDAKKDNELLELWGYTENSPKCALVAAYLCTYLPKEVKYNITNRYKNII